SAHANYHRHYYHHHHCQQQQAMRPQEVVDFNDWLSPHVLISEPSPWMPIQQIDSAEIPSTQQSMEDNYNNNVLTPLITSNIGFTEDMDAATAGTMATAAGTMALTPESASLLRSPADFAASTACLSPMTLSAGIGGRPVDGYMMYPQDAVVGNRAGGHHGIHANSSAGGSAGMEADMVALLSTAAMASTKMEAAGDLNKHQHQQQRQAEMSNISNGGNSSEAIPGCAGFMRTPGHQTLVQQANPYAAAAEAATASTMAAAVYGAIPSSSRQNCKQMAWSAGMTPAVVDSQANFAFSSSSSSSLFQDTAPHRGDLHHLHCHPALSHLYHHHHHQQKQSGMTTAITNACCSPSSHASSPAMQSIQNILLPPLGHSTSSSSSMQLTDCTLQDISAGNNTTSWQQQQQGQREQQQYLSMHLDSTSLYSNNESRPHSSLSSRPLLLPIMDVAEATTVDTVAAATDAGAISGGNNGYGSALDGMYGNANGSGGGGPCLSIGGDNNPGYAAPTTASYPSYPSSALCVQSLQLSLDASSPPSAYASLGAGDEFAAEQKIPVVSFISGGNSNSNSNSGIDAQQPTLRGRRGRKRKHPEALELVSTMTTTSGNSNGAGAGSGSTTLKRKQQQKRNPPATQEEEESGERGPKRRRRRTGNASNDIQAGTLPLQHTSAADSSTSCAGAAKSRYRLNNDQKRCFYQWLVKNIDNPYPQETDRNSDLAIQEISKQRFKWWFSNHRHRSLRPVQDENGAKKFIPRLAFYKTCAKLGVEIDWEIPLDIREKLNAMRSSSSTTTR
ncbi:hypothetical protein GGI11_002872, partial [Coemansia sp. RSA 2049]